MTIVAAIAGPERFFGFVETAMACLVCLFSGLLLLNGMRWAGRRRHLGTVRVRERFGLSRDPVTTMMFLSLPSQRSAAWLVSAATVAATTVLPRLLLPTEIGEQALAQWPLVVPWSDVRAHEWSDGRLVLHMRRRSIASWLLISTSLAIPDSHRATVDTLLARYAASPAT